VGGRFLNLVCQGAVRTPAPPQLRHCKEENVTKYAGSIYEYVTKAEKEEG